VAFGLLVVLVAALAGLPGRVASGASGVTGDADPVRPPALQGESAGTVAALEGALRAIYERVNPAVVSIQVIGGGLPGFAEEMLPDLPQVPQLPDQRPQLGQGSGFVWDEEGHIVTNHHVIDGAETIYVEFADGTLMEAEVVGEDPESDLAVLAVDPPSGFDWPAPLSPADAGELAVGQLAIAIGNPFGEEGTMTLGIISGLGRLLPNGGGFALGRYSIPDISQTDASVNPGNSGGVLLNGAGDLIGVPTAIASTTGSNSGVGYAIPVTIVERVVPALIEDGEYENPYLGISGMGLFPQLSEALGFEPTQQGALVVEVVEGSPASEGGLRGSDDSVTVDGIEYAAGGDVITAIDGEPVDDVDDLISYLATSASVGNTVELTLLRDDEEEVVEITLAARPSQGPQSATSPESPPVAPSTGQGVQLGILGQDVTPEVAAEEGLPEETEGVLVQRVMPGSAAAVAGLEPGDVITALDNEPIASVAELREALSDLGAGDSATLTILRDGEEETIDVTFGTA
jgi:2-alkenal reductase